jgi:uncharacterized sulfatase
MSSLTRRSLLAGSLLAARSALTAGSKRNVLFIVSDDLNNCLGCYGHPMVRTPNIDRIAKHGVRFEHSYCQFALCGPSRASVMTGLAPDTSRVVENQTQIREALPDVVTLPQLFQQNGYFAARVGKIYHYAVPSQIGTDGVDDKPSWNRAVNPNGVDHTKEESLLINNTPGRNIGNAACFHASSAPDDDHTDGITAAEIIRMMEQHRNDPFFLAAGFFRPHVPWIAPSKYFDLYPLEGIQALPFDESELHIAPEWAYFTNPANWGMSVLQRREAIRAYYASISFMDAQVGRLLDALDRLGLTQQTTIVFWGDNGYHLGEHGQWMKQMVFEPAARVPLVLGGAGVPSRGARCSRTVELLDIYPTLVEICGLKGRPSDLQGTSLMPLLARPDAAWDRPAITQILREKRGKDGVMGYSLRTERYRFSIWGEEGSLGEELYDYDNDARELHNLANQPEARPIRDRLRARLDRAIQSRRPNGNAKSKGI